MMKLVNSNDPILKKILTTVHFNDPHIMIIEIVEEMYETMKVYGGMGLAANQIGYDKRIIVIKAGGFNMTIINPVILRRYGGITTNKESCLSFRDEKPIIKVRYRRIEIEGFDEHGNPLKFKLKGLAAVVVQHEVDHLNGITII